MTYKIQSEEKDGVIHVFAEMPEPPKMTTHENYEVEPVPEFIEPKFLKLTHDQIKAMDTEELLKILSGEAYTEYDAISSPLQSLINAELQERSLIMASKAHWSVIPSFLLLIISVALALYANDLIPQAQVFYSQADISIVKDGNLNPLQEKLKEPTKQQPQR